MQSRHANVFTDILFWEQILAQGQGKVLTVFSFSLLLHNSHIRHRNIATTVDHKQMCDCVMQGFYSNPIAIPYLTENLLPQKHSNNRRSPTRVLLLLDQSKTRFWQYYPLLSFTQNPPPQKHSDNSRSAIRLSLLLVQVKARYLAVFPPCSISLKSHHHWSMQ